MSLECRYMLNLATRKSVHCVWIGRWKGKAGIYSAVNWDENLTVIINL